MHERGRVPTIDLDRRKPVWMALSEFYLDTELSDEDLKRIKTAFLASGYGTDEIRGIERMEVRPAVGANMFDVVGVWNGFDEQWLENRILEQIAKGGPTLLQRLFMKDSLTERYWRRLSDL